MLSPKRTASSSARLPRELNRWLRFTKSAVNMVTKYTLIKMCLDWNRSKIHSLLIEPQTLACMIAMYLNWAKSRLPQKKKASFQRFTLSHKLWQILLRRHREKTQDVRCPQGICQSFNRRLILCQLLWSKTPQYRRSTIPTITHFLTGRNSLSTIHRKRSKSPIKRTFRLLPTELQWWTLTKTQPRPVDWPLTQCTSLLNFDLKTKHY
jgi:hypothetical protein